MTYLCYHLARQKEADDHFVVTDLTATAHTCFTLRGCGTALYGLYIGMCGPKGFFGRLSL